MHQFPARFALAVISLGGVFALTARAAVVVPWAQRGSVDTDGDTVPDIIDNAPGVANDQADFDADGIGDVVDPTPSQSNPFLGDPGLGLFGPYTISAGSSAQIGYTMLATPPGAFGHIDIDFGGDNTYDATYFGPLTSSIDTIVIPANLFVDSLWDLNTPNAPAMYDFEAKAFAPGMWSANVSITGVSVTPEPASLALAGLLVPLALRRR